jgi:hypothetical protein
MGYGNRIATSEIPLSPQLRCPLCGTPLPQAKYDQVLKKHEALRAHLEHLRRREAELRIEKRSLAAEQQRLRKEHAAFRQRQKGELRVALRKQRDTFAKTVASQVEKATARARRVERREFQKKSREFGRVKSRLDSYERRMKTLAEKSRRQNDEITRLRDQIERGVTPQIEGLLEEAVLKRHLQDLFPDDRFELTGSKGGDVLHTVLVNGKKAGLIVYECKKVKDFKREYVLQASEARKQRHADYAVLVTTAFPSKNQFFFVDRDVLVISPAGLAPVVHTARESLVRLLILKATEAQRRKAVEEVYLYVAGTEYSSKVANVAAEMVDLGKELKREVGFHRSNWKKRYRIYRSVFSDIGAIDTKLRRLVTGTTSSDETKHIEARPSRLLAYPRIADLD